MEEEGETAREEEGGLPIGCCPPPREVVRGMEVVWTA
jgi:hypothetical protein